MNTMKLAMAFLPIFNSLVNGYPVRQELEPLNSQEIDENTYRQLLNCDKDYVNVFLSNNKKNGVNPYIYIGVLNAKSGRVFVFRHFECNNYFSLNPIIKWFGLQKRFYVVVRPVPKKLINSPMMEE